MASIETPIHLLTMEGFEDRLKDVLRLPQHMIVPEAKNAEASFPQKTVASSIICGSIQMLAPVEFDDNGGFRTDEIADVWTDHVLASELEAG